jgi:hypothetical protein
VKVKTNKKSKKPRGSYTLEVVARDENGFKDAAAKGRNVLTFTVG